MKVCAIIVTFNRKDPLIRVINAVQSQTLHVETILIIDNASTDGTKEAVINYLNIKRTEEILENQLYQFLDVSKCSVY